MKNKLKKVAIFAATLAMISAPKNLYANIIHHSADIFHSTTIFQGNMFDRDDNEPFNMYKMAFGDNYETIQNNSRNVNRTTYNDGIRMDVLSTGVVTSPYGQEGYVFFTLQDETGDRITEHMWLSITSDWQTQSKSATQLHFDEENNIATFVLRIWYFDNENFNNDYRNITIEIDHIYDDSVWINRSDDTITNPTIEVSSLLSGHNPSFITDVHEDVKKWWTRELELTGWSQGEIGRVDTVLENYLLAKGELNIPVEGVEGAYISNIALVDNILHVQTKENIEIRDIYSQQWFNLDLIKEVGDWTETAYWFAISDFDNNLNRIEGTHYVQRGYYIDNVDEINSYIFEIVSGSSNDTRANLEISFVSPVISNGITLEESKIINLGSEDFYVNNILISPMLVSFNVDVETESFNEFMNLYTYIINNLQVDLIFSNDTIESMPISWETLSFFMVYSEESESNIHRVSIANSFDVNELVAISINGTTFEV